MPRPKRPGPGDRVVISMDCRSPGTTTGKVGIYIGEMPRAYTLRNPSGQYQDVPFSYQAALLLEQNNIPCLDSLYDQVAQELGVTLPLAENLAPWYRKWLADTIVARIDRLESEAAVWFFNKNPLIAVQDADGEVDYIWGCECYWRPLTPNEDPLSPDEERAGAKDWAKDLVAAMETFAKAADRASTAMANFPEVAIDET